MNVSFLIHPAMKMRWDMIKIKMRWGEYWMGWGYDMRWDKTGLWEGARGDMRWVLRNWGFFTIVLYLDPGLRSRTMTIITYQG